MDTQVTVDLYAVIVAVEQKIGSVQSYISDLQTRKQLTIQEIDTSLHNACIELYKFKGQIEMLRQLEHKHIEETIKENPPALYNETIKDKDGNVIAQSK